MEETTNWRKLADELVHDLRLALGFADYNKQDLTEIVESELLLRALRNQSLNRDDVFNGVLTEILTNEGCDTHAVTENLVHKYLRYTLLE